MADLDQLGLRPHFTRRPLGNLEPGSIDQGWSLADVQMICHTYSEVNESWVREVQDVEGRGIACRSHSTNV